MMTKQVMIIKSSLVYFNTYYFLLLALNFCVLNHNNQYELISDNPMLLEFDTCLFHYY